MIIFQLYNILIGDNNYTLNNISKIKSSVLYNIFTITIRIWFKSRINGYNLIDR